MRDVKKDRHREVALVLSGVNGKQPQHSLFEHEHPEHVEG